MGTVDAGHSIPGPEPTLYLVDAHDVAVSDRHRHLFPAGGQLVEGEFITGDLLLTLLVAYRSEIRERDDAQDTGR